MENVYRKIRDCVSNIGDIMTFLKFLDIKKGVGTLDELNFDCLKRLYEQKLDICVTDVGKELCIFATEIPTYRLEFIIKDLIGVATVFSDDKIKHFYENFFIEDSENVRRSAILHYDLRMPMIFDKDQRVVIMDAIQQVHLFLLSFPWYIHTICCEHRIENMKMNFEKFLNDTYRTGSNGNELTANHMFPINPIKPDSRNEGEIQRKEGKNILQRWYILCALLNAKKNKLFKDDFTVSNRDAASKLFAELFGYGEGSLRHALWDIDRNRSKGTEKTEKLINEAKEFLKGYNIE